MYCITKDFFLFFTITHTHSDALNMFSFRDVLKIINVFQCISYIYNFTFLGSIDLNVSAYEKWNETKQLFLLLNNL